MVVDGVPTIDLLAPDLQFAFQDLRRRLWDEDVKSEGCSSQLPLVFAVAPKLESRFGVP